MGAIGGPTGVGPSYAYEPPPYPNAPQLEPDAATLRDLEEFDRVLGVLRQPRSLSPRGAAVYEEIVRLLQTGPTDWAVTDRDTRKILGLLETLGREDWLAVISRLNTKQGPDHPSEPGYQRSTLLDKFGRRGLQHDPEHIELFAQQVARHLGTGESEAIDRRTAEMFVETLPGGKLEHRTLQDYLVAAGQAALIPFGVVWWLLRGGD
ncbi:MAG: hypothetical protein KatS3mg102_1963 [Planctomycetota bacterium]|nr:MAG: hypothetical protein KatS3mg102_1963 [Planctomycetota bacterium]